MNRFKDKFKKADESFNKKYSKELELLKGFSEEEKESVTPDTQSHEDLIKVVEEASKNNLEQAKLIENIKLLGDTAIKIAKKLPKFKDLL